MNAIEQERMRRARKAEVLLAINETEGTLSCLRVRLVAARAKLKEVDSAIDRRLNPMLQPGYEPSMKEGRLSMLSITGDAKTEIDLPELMNEIEVSISAFSSALNELHGLRKELQTL